MKWLLDHYQTPSAHEDWPYSIKPNGYAAIKDRGIHAIVAELVHGPRPGDKEAAHSCRNRHCYYAEHVSWKTPTENAADRVRDGTALQGGKHHRAKLTATQVLEIRTSDHSQRALAKEYGVTRWTIQGILTREAWKHV
jgi:HNH endonuclease